MSVSCVAGTAFADSRTGFMLRVNAGTGYSDTSRDLGGEVGRLSIRGVSALGQFAIGGFIRPNLALHATLFGFEAEEPTIEDKMGERTESDVRDTTLSMHAMGVGLTYYLMPANVYFTASVGSGRAIVEVTDGNVRAKDKSKDGFLTTAAIAKEWYVTSDWSLGLGGQLQYALIPVGAGADCFGSCDTELQSYAGGIFFSATYN